MIQEYPTVRMNVKFEQAFEVMKNVYMFMILNLTRLWDDEAELKQISEEGDAGSQT